MILGNEFKKNKVHLVNMYRHMCIVKFIKNGKLNQYKDKISEIY